MRKLAKRLSALLLAALMLLGASLSAMAVDADLDGEDAVAITYDDVNVKVNNVQSGDTIHAYRLVQYNDQHYNSYTVENEFAKYIVATYPNDVKSAADVPEFLSKKSAADMNIILEGFATACSAGTYTLPKEFTSETATNSSSVTLSLQPGYYLLLATTTGKNGRVYKPMSVFVRVDGTQKIVYGGNSNAALTPDEKKVYTIQSKSQQGPTSDKKVSADDNQWKSTATAGVGETAKFYVKVDIPAYKDIKSMNLWVEDTLTNMKYIDGSAKLYREVPGEDAEVVADAVTLESNSGYTVSEDGKTGTQKLKFKLDYEKIVGGNTETEKTVYLYYEATVQKEAVRAGTNSGVNTAKLIYSNAATPDSEMETDPSTTKVYDFNFDLKKFKSDSEDHLAGAKFSLYRTKEDAEADQNPIEFVADANGSDYYRPLDDSDSQDKAVTVLEANFQIRGLDAGTYYLREVETPQGYYQPKGVFKIVLTSKMENNGEHGGRLQEATSGMTAENDQDADLVFAGSVSGDRGNTLSVSLKNSTTPSLPTTGGMGTMLFTIGGIALMGLAVYLFFFRKKSTAK